MKCYEPDFYNKFRCTADKCRHSCCVGWEIDVDEDSLRRYSMVKGSLGEELRKNISAEGGAHFILDEKERCPFLMRTGLCRLITELGEDSLCDICAQHPRFYNFYTSRQERGLGLCCEEAVRLLMENDEPFKIVLYEDTGDDSPQCPEITFRGSLMEIIADRSSPLKARICKCLELCGAKKAEPDMSFWREIYLRLERMDEDWTKRLVSLEDKEALNIEKVRYEKLLSYFLYRHFANLAEDFGYGEAFAFCALSTAFIASLDCCGGEDNENIRLYSSEIEYSDENIELLMEIIAERQQ